MFDLDKLKENIVPIAIIVVLLICAIAGDYAFSIIEKKEEKLADKDIKVNALVINEIVSSNGGTHSDEYGNTYDWIELYNGTGKDIDLTNYGLTDEDAGATKWLFPSVTIKSKEYLVIYLAKDKVGQGLYANFALNKNGDETITLKKANGKVVDAVKVPSIKKGNCLARNFSGTWIETNEITPSYSNNDAGRNEYLSSIKGTSDKLVISEVLPSNQGNVIFDGNKLYSYIEVYNSSDETINLKEYFLSNDSSRPFMWRLPNVELKKGETYLVYTNNKDTGNNTSFTLNKKSGSVTLSHLNKVVETVEYDDLPNGVALIRNEDKFYEGNNITPGYPNTNKGKENFEASVKNPKDLIINEVMSANHRFLAQNGGKYYDWIELYNNSGKDIKLNNYYLTIDYNNKKRYQLPNKTLKDKEYIIIMASGDTALSNKNYNHANFKISALESIFLYKDDELVDAINIYNIPINYSYGRGVNGGHYYFESPSPKNKNAKTGSIALSYNPTFSKSGGIYNGVDNLKIELAGNGTIYYTLDGSVPTKNSKVYNSPIVLKKTTVIRARSYESGKKSSEVVTNSYIINENHTLPVVSLSMPNSSLVKVNTNIQNNSPVNAHCELYEKNSNFSIDCGFKIFGGDSRMLPKKSYALKFSSKYESKLDYRVFPNREAVEYNTLVLRSGSQDMQGTMFRDEFVTSILDDYGTVDVQANKPVILYINGKYWGIYYMREKIDAEFVEHHYNVTKGKTNIVRIDYDIATGSSSDYRRLVTYVGSHDMTNDKNYDYVSKKLDIDNYIDFWIAQIYSGDYDVRNIRFFNNKYIDNGKIKLIAYDFDFSFHAYPGDYFNWMTTPGGMGYFRIDNTLIRGLLRNEKFKKRFLERLSYNLQYVWTEKNINKNFNYYYNAIKPEIKRDHQRWGFSYSKWQSEVNTVKSFLNSRRKNILTYTKNYFNLSDKEMKKYFEK